MSKNETESKDRVIKRPLSTKMKYVNKIFIILSLLVFSSCAFKPNRVNDLKKMNLNGDIESVKFTQFEAIVKDGKLQKQLIESSDEIAYLDNQYLFNEKGMIHTHIQYISNRMTRKHVYGYDIKLNIISKKYYDYSGKLVNESHFEHVINENGDLVEEKEIINGKHIDRNVVVTVFQNQNVIEKINYVGNLISDKKTFKYNKSNRIIEEKHLLADNESYMIVKKYYNEKGNMIKTVMLDENSETISFENYEYLKYDDQGNWIEVITSGKDGLKFLIENEIIYRD
jgi:hypothetical protein